MNEVKEPDLSYDKLYTYEDYLNFNFEYMVELIRGRIYKMTPAPGTKHQSILGNLHVEFALQLKGKDCRVFLAPTDVVLPIENKKRNKSTTVVQPDICIFCDTSMIEKKAVFGPPTLIVEILSPHTKKKDLQLKFDLYEEAGVPEYWIIMPIEELVEQFVLEQGKYIRTQTFTKEDIIESKVVSGLIVSLAEVFHF